MQRIRSRLASEWGLVSAGLALLVGLAAWLGWFARADLVYYDLALAAWQREAPADILIVAVDDASLADLGRWPWPRARHASLIERISAGRPRAIGLDILLDEPDRTDPRNDVLLAAAMEASGKVVLPAILESGGRDFAPPRLASSAAAVGHGNVVLDADGLARSVWLKEGRSGAELPHFAYAVAHVADSSRFPLAEPGRGVGLDMAFWHRQFPMLIPYAGPPGHFHTIPAADVLAGKLAPDIFRGRIVLIGVTAAGIGDNNPVPTSGNGRVMSGVEIAANTVDALERGVALRLLPPVLVGAITALLVVGLMVGLRRLSPRGGLLLSVLMAVCALLFSVLLLRLGQAWFPPSALLLGCVLGYPLWSWRRLESAQRFLDEELLRLGREGGLLDMPGGHYPVTVSLEQRISLVRTAAQQQRDARRFVADALESLPAGVLVANRAGRIALANRRAGRLLGLREVHTPVGLGLAELLSRLKPVSGEGEARLGDPKSWRALKMEVSSPAAPALLLDVAPCRDEKGHFIGLIASLTDVSELKAARRARDDAMRFLSHDLRSPLATIITLLEGARDGEAGTAAPDLLGRIERYARRSLALADDMLRLGRAEAADRKSFVDLDLRALLMEAADEVWPVGDARGVAVVCDLDDAGGQDEGAEALVRGDRDMLRRAVVNLLTNAIKFSGAGAGVRLQLRGEGTRWKVTVADEGPGIAEENLPRLFTRYGRFPVSREFAEEANADGIGLGLVIVKAVVDAHGGSIEVDSAPGRGTRFIIALPEAASPES